MPARPDSADVTLGFLSVNHDDERGYVGGYLVLNRRGRPIEFRCTSPVQPSQAQRVLFGPTLAPYVCGELISEALFTHTKAQPDLLLTDHADNMSARHRLQVPLLLVNRKYDPAHDAEVRETDRQAIRGPCSSQGDSAANATRRLAVDSAGTLLRGPKWVTFAMGQRSVSALAEFTSDQPRSLQLWEQTSDWIDLAEPFDRIAEAIDEALRG